MNNHVARKPLKQLLESSYQTCFTQTDNLRCMQLIATKTFKNNVTNCWHKIWITSPVKTHAWSTYYIAHYVNPYILGSARRSIFVETITEGI